jgi:hypothetical protein
VSDVSTKSDTGEETKNAYKVLVGTPRGKILLWRFGQMLVKKV